MRSDLRREGTCCQAQPRGCVEGAGGGAARAAGASRPGEEQASCRCRREAHTSNGGEELQAAWRSRPAPATLTALVNGPGACKDGQGELSKVYLCPITNLHVLSSYTVS